MTASKPKPEDAENLRTENRALKGALAEARQESAGLRLKLDLFAAEHRLFGWFGKLVLLGPRLEESLRRWLAKASPSNPLPVNETAAVGAAIIKRFLKLGLLAVCLGYGVPQGLMLWQNLLIRSQNEYFREQLLELRRQLELQGQQITLQEEQGDFVRRNELLALVYGGRERGVSSRVRIEALKALVRLENKLLDRSESADPLIDLRNVDFSCPKSGSPDCADFSGAWLVRADFSGSDFQGANFETADLRGSRFLGANLKQAKLGGADLEGAKFRDDLPGLIHMGVASGNVGPLLVEFDSLGFTVVHYFALRRIYKTLSREHILRYFYMPLELGAETSRDSDLIAFVNKISRAPDGNVFAKNYSFDSLVDVNTRLPAGIRPPSGGQEFGKQLALYERVLALQQRADRLLGTYVADIDLGINNRVICRRYKDYSSSTYTLDDYEQASLAEQEGILRKICNVRPWRSGIK